jgi:hypothetical protein
MDRRALGEMLAEIAEGAAAAAGVGLPVHATRMELSLPVEIRLLHGDVPVLLGDVPLYRWRTDFDAPASRVSVVWEEDVS